MTTPIEPGTISPLPPAPNAATDSVAEFDLKANAFVAGQVAMVPQVNDVAAKTYQNSVSAHESAEDAAISAGAAASSASAASTSAGSAATSESNSATNAENARLSALDAAASAEIVDPPYLLNRAHHTGEQAISTVTGLQTALDGKETPSGALAQMQGFGLGSLTPPTLSNINNWRSQASSLMRVASTSTGDKPSDTGVISLMSYSAADGGAALFINRSAEAARVWAISAAAEGAAPWVELARGRYDLTSATSANAVITSTNAIARSTSSLRYKTHLEAYEYSRALQLVQAIEPFFYRSHGSSLDPDEYSFYGLAAEQLAEIDPRFVHWGYSDDDYETVAAMRTEQRQATEMVDAQEQYVEIVDGRAVLRERTVQRETPIFDEYPLFDAEGNALDAVHRVPRMIDVEVQETERRLKANAVQKPTGVMYDRIVLAVLMVLQREVLGINRSDEMSPELESLADQYCPDRQEAAHG